MNQNCRPLIFSCLLLSYLLSIGCSREPQPRIPVQFATPEPVEKKVTEYPTKWKGSGVVTVARGVHVLANVSPSATFVIETNDGVILIDTGSDEAAASVRDSLMELQIKDLDVRHILLTHAHYDHVLGSNFLKGASGALVHAGKEDCEVIRSVDTESLFSVFPSREVSVDDIRIDHELVDGDVIEQGGTRIEALALPGHTPGSICYRMERDGQTILFSGDVIASLNFGPAIYPVDISPKYRGDAEAYLTSLDRLLGMQPPDLLLPGHPEQHVRPRSIRLSSEEWQTMLGSARDRVRRIVANHQADGRDFLDDQAKVIEPGLAYLGIIEGVGIYCWQVNGQLILFNAAGGEGFAAFVRSRLDALGVSAEPDTLLLGTYEDSLASAVSSLGDKTVVVCPTAFSKALRAEVKQTVLDAEDWPGALAAEMQAISLAPGVAYQMDIDGKSVLITPDAPQNLALIWKNPETGQKTFGPLEPQTSEFEGKLRASNEFVVTYGNWLGLLGKFAPDVWLPLRPTYGQNANLYDDRWEDILESNARVLPADWFLNLKQ